MAKKNRSLSPPAAPERKPHPAPSGLETRWLEILAELSPAAIYRADASGSCLWVNEQWAQLTGRPAETALGQGWEQAIHPADRARLKRDWPRITAERGFFIGEYRYLRPDGSVRWVLGRATEERDADGRLLGYIGVTVDVTELREAQAHQANGNGNGKREWPSTARLTARERQVAILLAEGRTNKSAAERLGISVRTAEAHRARIMRKLHLDSLAALVRYAIQHGLTNG